MGGSYGKKLKKKPNVINIGDEEASRKAFEEIERPIGRKAENEKRKSKEHANPSVIPI